MTSELRAALERALAFDQKSFAAWDADYFREHNATVPTRLAVAQRENARLAPLHAAMLDVIAAAERASAEIQAQKTTWPGEVDTLADALTALRETLDGVK
jgi:hypothetical protein